MTDAITMTNGLADERVIDLLSRGSPLQRLGSPEEIVNAMLGIISPDNSYLNGQCIAVDGGVSAI